MNTSPKRHAQQEVLKVNQEAKYDLILPSQFMPRSPQKHSPPKEK